MDGTNALNWFDISVNDIARAKKFYEAIFEIKMDDMDMMGMKMSFFPSDMNNGKVGGGLVQGPMHKPRPARTPKRTLRHGSCASC